jgi:enterochelin esterase-like enzyme
VEEQAPHSSENGQVFFENTVSPGGIKTSYGVYLPYNFDVNRAEPYPILVLYHGGGGFEGSWLNNGLANIMDNMIAEGRMEPTVVVTPNGSDFPDPTYSWDRPAILDYVVNGILPHMQETYHVSADASRHALAGLSQGGATIMHGYFNYTEAFDYYICMSAPMRGNVNPNFEKAALKDVNLFIGFGLYDHVVTRAFYNERVGAAESSTFDYVYGLATAGVPFTVKMDLHYGHQWSLWRELAVYAFDHFLWK